MTGFFAASGLQCSLSASSVRSRILAPMRPLLDPFWRAAAYCLHPRVILLSLLPLLIAAGATFALGYFFWEAALDGVRGTLEGWSFVALMLQSRTRNGQVIGGRASETWGCEFSCEPRPPWTSEC